MVKFARLLPALLTLLVMLAPAAQAQDNVEINVDRTELARGETLTLTIRVYDQRQGLQLDLTPLTDQFDVLGTRTSSQIRSINNSVESWTDYVVTLFPLSEGELSIPSLSINNTETDPITVTVVNEGPRSNQSDEELFLEIETNKESVYVQEQLLFTVRLFYTINGIRNPQFTELEMPDTVTQLIGTPNQYERLIDGVRYGVYEKRYVIFPQRSGPLEIPDILFRGEVTDGTSNFVFRNLNTRRVTAFIEGITVDVKERPAVAQELDFWLPVSNLEVEERWSPPLSELQVGDSVQRIITVVADGLDGAVLPPINADQIDGMNLYPEPPEIERNFIDGQIVGRRVETVTLVATASGQIEIPEISIPWWNVNSDALEASVVPATRIQVASVAGDLPSEQAVASTENLTELLEQAPVVDQAMIDAQNEADIIEVGSFWLDALIALAFAIVVLSIARLTVWPHRQRLMDYVSLQRQAYTSRYLPENNEKVAYRQLLAACRSRDLQAVRRDLIVWVDHIVESRPIRSMEDILQQQEAPSLHPFASAIQSRLFNAQASDSEAFSPEQLQQCLTELRRQRQQDQRQRQQQERYQLPPLYRS